MINLVVVMVMMVSLEHEQRISSALIIPKISFDLQFELIET